MAGSANPASWLAVFVAGIAAVFAALAFFAGGGEVPGDDWEARVKRAVDLQTNKLYAAAIEEFVPLVDNPAVPKTKRANYAYSIGEMYQDQLGDYQNAAAYLIRARSLDPRPALDTRIGRRLVECFENLGRSFDAARQLANYTAGDDKQKAPAGELVVARIGEREITLSEVERELQKLPAGMQGEFSTPGKKIEFVRQYVGMELLYKSALRRGIDRQPELQQNYADLKKQIVLEQMLKIEILDKIEPTDVDLDVFYRAHKTDFFNDRPYEEVRAQVYQQYRGVKQREKYAELIGDLITAESVTIYEEHLK